MKKAYKLLSLVILLCSCAMFTSCEKDDDITKNASIIGTWVRSYSEVEDGVTYSFTDYLVFNSNGTGYNTETYAASTRAQVSESKTDYFNWAENTTADNVRYIEIIHTSGDQLIDSGRFTFSLIDNKLNIFNVVYTKQ